jgi:NADH-quinone oxidoreductase subunit M
VSTILPLTLMLPMIGAVCLLFVPKEEHGVLRGVGLAFSLATFLVSLGIITGFDGKLPGFQLVYDKEWIGAIGVHFKLGVDGMSIWLVILTTFLTPLVLLSSHEAIQRKVKEFMICFLILETGMIGTFLALDLFLFYVMWEVMLIPMYLIIGVWGGDRKIYASIKFVIFTMVGSLLMLVAIFYVYVAHAQAGGGWTFDLEKLWNLQLTHGAQMWCFLAFALAFAIKVPLFPLHTWLPDAHVEAPTAGSVILAGVLLKMGVYGFIRYAIPMFPNAAQMFGPWLLALAVIGVVYGAMTAYVQEDVKKLVAYSSVSHMGFCILGLFAFNVQGIEGSIYTMLSHGLTTSGLFLGIGVLYERRHTRKLSEFGGVWKKMPLFAGLYLIITLGSAGLPGLSGFVGEFLALIGAYGATAPGRSDVLPYAQVTAIVATTGVVFGAVYLLTMFQKVFFGKVTNPKNEGLRDLTGREILVFLPIVLAIFFLGMYPKPFLSSMEPAVANLRRQVEKKRKEPAAENHLVEAAVPVAAPGGPPDEHPPEEAGHEGHGH